VNEKKRSGLYFIKNMNLLKILRRALLLIFFTVVPLSAGPHSMHSSLLPEARTVPPLDELFHFGPFYRPVGAEKATLQQALEEGYRALWQLDDASASEWFRTALQLAPQDARAYAGLALSFDRWPGLSLACALQCRELTKKNRAAVDSLSQALAALADDLCPGEVRPRRIEPSQWEDTWTKILTERVEKATQKDTPLLATAVRHTLMRPAAAAFLAEAEKKLAQQSSDHVLLKLKSGMDAMNDRPAAQTDTSFSSAYLLRQALTAASRSHWASALRTARQALDKNLAALNRTPWDARRMDEYHQIMRQIATAASFLGLSDIAHTAASEGSWSEKMALMIRLRQWQPLIDDLGRWQKQTPDRNLLPFERFEREHAQALALIELGDQEKAAAAAQRVNGLFLEAQAQNPPLSEPLRAWLTSARDEINLARRLRANPSLAKEDFPQDQLVALSGLPPIRYAQWSQQAGSTEVSELALQRALATPQELGQPELPWLRRGLGENHEMVKQIAHRSRTSDLAETDRAPLPRWEPPRPASISLPDVHGRAQPLNDAGSHPRVIVFYLGYRCDHCVQHLRKFVPWQETLAQQKITLTCVSTDNTKFLPKTPVTVPLVADPEHRAFRAWGAWDQFTNKPIHGTCIVNAAGQVIWQAVGYQPYMDTTTVVDLARQAVE
jgi:peroxiredoxin